MAYNIDKIVNQLLSSLSARQKEVVSCRYGLQSGAPMTLAKIGDRYGVTRERIRQIEDQALNNIYSHFKGGEFDGFIGTTINYFQKFNGARKDEYVCRDFKKASAKPGVKNSNQKVRFLLEACREIKLHPEDENFYAFWHLSNNDLAKAESFINNLINKLKSFRGKLAPNSLGNDQNSENYISLSKNFAVNVYGDFGLSEWGEINPKVSRDWAYLVLKKENKPLHFTKMASLINKYRKTKKVNYQTIHNELIKDDRFVLVGRGTYGLREFNIVPGTAREVITHLLKKHGPLAAKNLVTLVLKQRSFKEKTLLLSLRNKKYFQCQNDGRYCAKEV